MTFIIAPLSLGAVETITHWLFGPIERTGIYKDTFFPETIRDWNALPDSIISAEGADDGVARFTSLVRARH